MHQHTKDSSPLRTGVIGVSGYGGGEVVRILETHPHLKLVYAVGESSAGQKLRQRFPGIGAAGELTIEKWDPAHAPDVDVLFISLPTGQSRQAVANIPASVKIIDIGGDHRWVDGWTYGLADVWPDQIAKSSRIANPGCYPSASLIALAPLLKSGMFDATAPIIIDAKSGVSGAGRGGADSALGFAEVNEDVYAYGLHKHAHLPEIKKAAHSLAGNSAFSISFTPHLIPMTRGILATCYLKGVATTEQCLDAARTFYANRPFVRVVEKPPHTKWATGSNLVFISYSAGEDGTIIALGAIDNLGKGAAGQAVQNANLMLGIGETVGLEQMALWP